MERIICLAIGYICGLLQTGYLVGRLNHVDIRKEGSGNAGSTNALRVMGWKACAMTFAGDVIKCLAAVLIARYFYRDAEYVPLLAMYAGMGATLGHNFPFYLKFKGGKGIATTAGMMLAFCPWAVPVCLVLFTLSIFVKKYVSVGSLLVCIGFFVQTVIFGKNGMLGAQALAEIYAVVGAVCVLGVIRHQSNIKRLLSGTENKVFVHEENQ